MYLWPSSITVSSDQTGCCCSWSKPKINYIVQLWTSLCFFWLPDWEVGGGGCWGGVVWLSVHFLESFLLFLTFYTIIFCCIICFERNISVVVWEFKTIISVLGCFHTCFYVWTQGHLPESSVHLVKCENMQRTSPWSFWKMVVWGSLQQNYDVLLSSVVCLLALRPNPHLISSLAVAQKSSYIRLASHLQVFLSLKGCQYLWIWPYVLVKKGCLGAILYEHKPITHCKHTKKTTHGFCSAPAWIKHQNQQMGCADQNTKINKFTDSKAAG